MDHIPCPFDGVPLDPRHQKTDQLLETQYPLNFKQQEGIEFTPEAIGSMKKFGYNRKTTSAEPSKIYVPYNLNPKSQDDIYLKHFRGSNGGGLEEVALGNFRRAGATLRETGSIMDGVSEFANNSNSQLINVKAFGIKGENFLETSKEANGSPVRRKFIDINDRSAHTYTGAMRVVFCGTKRAKRPQNDDQFSQTARDNHITLSWGDVPQTSQRQGKSFLRIDTKDLDNNSFSSPNLLPSSKGSAFIIKETARERNIVIISERLNQRKQVLEKYDWEGFQDVAWKVQRKSRTQGMNIRAHIDNELDMPPHVAL
jgi:hypothetical protein